MIVDKKYRFDDLEFRWTETLGVDKKQYPEIVCWIKKDDGSEYCYTLASWIEDSEGWELKFVGDRPFEYERVDPRLFWTLAHVGNTIVNADWRMQKFMKER